MAAPGFIFFDMGNVLIHFDPQVAHRRLAELANVPPERVRLFLEEDNLQWRYEAGKVTSRDFFDRFCESMKCQLSDEALIEAAGSQFTLNVEIVPVVTQLAAANRRMGILSNTCEAHWKYCADTRFTVLRTAFDVAVLSYSVHAMKPDPQIYVKAAEMAGSAPAEIFFTDDRAENVEGARDCGFDAVQYTTTPELVAALRERGVEFNY